MTAALISLDPYNTTYDIGTGVSRFGSPLLTTVAGTSITQTASCC